MHQGRLARGSGAHRARRGERGAVQVPVAGVTLIAVLALIAVSSILMGRAAETWDSQVRHELEETLIARGEEYRRAIEIFQRTNGRLPNKLEELCPKGRTDVRYIRRCWRDPVTGEEFRLILPGEVGKTRRENEMRRQQEEGALGPAGLRDRQGPSLSDVQFSLPGQESKIEWSEDQPFVGVASTSDHKAFRAYLGSEVYNEWEFVALLPMAPPQPSPPPGVGGTPGAPGGPGATRPGMAPRPAPRGTPPGRFPRPRPTPRGGG